MKKEQFKIGDRVEVKDGGCKGWKGHVETISDLGKGYRLVAVRNEKTGHWGYFQEKQLKIIKCE